METIQNYLDSIFANLPDTEEMRKARNEMYQMMEDKFQELIDDGVAEDTAVGTVIAECGNLSDISEALGIEIKATDNSNHVYESEHINTNKNANPTPTNQKSSWKPFIIVAIIIFCIFVSILVGTVVTILYNAGIIFNSGNVDSSSVNKPLPNTSNLVDESSTNDTFENLKLDINAANIQITSGETLSCQYDGSDAYAPRVFIESSTLTITQEAASMDGNIGTIYLVLPENIYLDSLDVSITSGNINISNTSMSSVDIDVQKGNAEIANSVIEDLYVSIEYGNAIIVTDADISDASIDLSANDGNVTINGRVVDDEFWTVGDISSNNSITVSVEHGDIDISDK